MFEKLRDFAGRRRSKPVEPTFEVLVRNAGRALRDDVKRKLSLDSRADVDAELGRLQTIQGMLEKNEQLWSLEVAIILLLITVLVVVTACSAFINVSDLNVSYAFSTNAVEFRTVREIGLVQQGGGGSLFVRNAGDVDLRGAGADLGVISKPGTLEVAAIGSTLSIETSPGTTIRYACRGKDAEASFIGAKARLRVTNSRESSVTVVPSNIDPPKTLVRTTTPFDSIVIESGPDAPLVLQGARADLALMVAGQAENVRFTEEESDDLDGAPVHSAVTDGKLLISPGEASYALDPSLDIQMVKDFGRLVINPSTEKCLSVRFSGQAKDVLLGRGGNLKTLAPTWLQHARREWQLGATLTIVISLLTTAFGFIRWMQKRNMQP